MTPKKQFYRAIPGRIRLVVDGLRKNRLLEELIVSWSNRREGVLKLDSSIDTGRILVLFDERQIDLSTVVDEVREIELKAKQLDVAGEVAVTSDSLGTNVNGLNYEQSKNLLPESISNVVKPVGIRSIDNNQPPLPLLLSICGLGMLGIKQMVFGRSPLSRNTGAFHFAALVSAVSGYPLLNRGLKNVSERKRINSDLILGASALGLALARENLVVLAGLGILQYLKWEKSRTLPIDKLKGDINLELPAEILNYSEQAGKTSLLAAGAAWALSRDPILGLAVLLAGNPRVATLPAEYAWNQAELEVHKKGILTKEDPPLAKLAQVKTVVFEDTSLICEKQVSEIQCISMQGEENKLWCLAASLMKKTDHPWREEIMTRAKTAQGTIRTAFKVQESKDGIIGEVNSAKLYLGNSKFLEQNGIDCSQYLLDIKRKQREGNQVECLARSQKLLGYFVRQQGGVAQEFNEAVTVLRQNNLQLIVLNNRLEIEPAVLAKAGINVEYLDSKPEEIFERLTALQQQGEELMVMTDNEAVRQTLKDSGIVAVKLTEAVRIGLAINYAQTIRQTVQQHFKAAKAWNAAGVIFAVTSMLTAPVINLVGDAITLLMLARSKQISEHPYTLSSSNNETTAAEVAVTNESGVIEQLHTTVSHPTANQVSANSQIRLQTQRPSQLLAIPWHSLSSEEVLQRFEVGETGGLTVSQVDLQREQYGINQLEQKKPTPWISAYLAQFKEFTTLVVLGTSVLAFFSGSMFDGIAMGAILLANAAIGMIQERKAEKVIEALDQFQPPKCSVIRENMKQELVGTDLVPGDIVCLEAGDRVPADLRLIRTWNLEVNEGALTGESVPVAKDIEVTPLDCPLADRKNMLFMGTDITRGKGLGVVVQTGMQTEIGFLMTLMKEQEKVVTPLHDKVTRITKTFVKGAALAGGIVFLVGILQGRPLTQMITSSVTLAASAVPEGLPVTITIALSAGIFRMSKQNALIRKLSALETLGRTTVICTDKTGTLTKNEMTVRKIATVHKVWQVSGEGYEPTGTIISKDEKVVTIDHESQDKELKQLMHISLLCNNSMLEEKEERWQVKGDPTEGALLTMSAKYGLWPAQMTQWHRVHEVPFDSSSGTMSVVCREQDKEQECFLLAKGSVEAILEQCRWYQNDGEILPFTDEVRESILKQNTDLAQDALRVLGFAYAPIEWFEGQSEIAEDNLIYVGLVGMMDPPKSEVEKSIREAYALGVTPVMITGDHPVTALAIAKELGLSDKSSRVITGQELDGLSDQALETIVETISIYARVTPEHKLRIVKAYQRRGHIVAMTGDGVNDTPAIKQANVGIAMGKTGTEVTKATADMVLKKDHFGSILEGVKEGRTIIGNIRRAIGCLLTGNLAEILVSATAVIIGLPMPLVPIQILLMNLLTDAIPAMILAINPSNSEIKQTKRVDVADKELYQKVITRGILLGMGSLALFASTLAAGQPLVVAQTVAFSTLVVGQLIQTLSWRNEGTENRAVEPLNDRYLVGGMAASFAALLGALYLPPAANFFHSAPIGVQQWLYIALIAGAVSILSKPFLLLTNRFRQPRTVDTQSLEAFAG